MIIKGEQQMDFVWSDLSRLCNFLQFQLFLFSSPHILVVVVMLISYRIPVDEFSCLLISVVGYFGVRCQPSSPLSLWFFVFSTFFVRHSSVRHLKEFSEFECKNICMKKKIRRRQWSWGWANWNATNSKFPKSNEGGETRTRTFFCD